MLLFLVLYFIKEAKDRLEKRLDSVDEQLYKVSKDLDQKTQFIISKIMQIPQDKENLRATVYQAKENFENKSYSLDKKIRELKDKLDKFDEDMVKDLNNFKKIMVKFRIELNELTSFIKRDEHGSKKTGSD